MSNSCGKKCSIRTTIGTKESEEINIRKANVKSREVAVTIKTWNAKPIY